MRRTAGRLLAMLAIATGGCLWTARGSQPPSEGGGGGYPRTAPGSNTVVVTVTDSGFQPSTLLITVGTVVVFRDQARSHPVIVTGDDLSWSSGRMTAGSEYQVSFQRQGRFFYHDQLHPGDRGTIEVH